MSPHEGRRRRLASARDAMPRGAALLLDHDVLEDAVPCAAVLAAAALVHLRAVDVGGRHGERMVELVEMLRADRAARREVER